jgi:hypothetical protein
VRKEEKGSRERQLPLKTQIFVPRRLFLLASIIFGIMEYMRKIKIEIGGKEPS